MANKKIKINLGNKTKKIDTIQQIFFERINKLRNKKNRLFANLTKKFDQESIEKLRKTINESYK